MGLHMGLRIGLGLGGCSHIRHGETIDPSAETQQTHLRLLRSVESQGGPLLVLTEKFVMCR